MASIKQLLADILKNGARTEEDYHGGKLITITTETGKYTFAQYPDETDEDVLNWLIKRGKKQERLMNTKFDTKAITKTNTPKTEPMPLRYAGHWFFFFNENKQIKNVA